MGRGTLLTVLDHGRDVGTRGSYSILGLGVNRFGRAGGRRRRPYEVGPTAPPMLRTRRRPAGLPPVQSPGSPTGYRRRRGPSADRLRRTDRRVGRGDPAARGPGRSSLCGASLAPLSRPGRAPATALVRREPRPDSSRRPRQGRCHIVPEVPASIALVVNLAGHDVLDGSPLTCPCPSGGSTMTVRACGRRSNRLRRGPRRRRHAVPLWVGRARRDIGAASCAAPDLSTHPLFGAENRVQLLWKSLPLLLQKVRELRDTRCGRLRVRRRPPGPGRRRGPGGRVPLILALVAATPGVRAGFVLRRSLWREQWFLLLGEPTRYEPASAFRPAHALVPAADRYWADPSSLPRGEDRFDPRGGVPSRRAPRSHRASPPRQPRREWRRSGPCSNGSAIFRTRRSSSWPVSCTWCPNRARARPGRCLPPALRYPWRWEHAGTLLSDLWACDCSIVSLRRPLVDVRDRLPPASG